MNRIITLVIGVLFFSASLFAQTQKLAVVDFEKAVAESVEGKKASGQFNAKLEERRRELEQRQKELQDIENRLRTAGRAMNDTVRADLTRDADRRRTELTRLNEDAQKELGALREQLLRPIAEKASQILNAHAAAQGYTMVIDLSHPQNNAIWFDPASDITNELVQKIDTETAKPIQQ